MRSQTKKTPKRSLFLAIALAAPLLLTVGLFGCGDSSDADAILAPEATTSTLGMAPPTMEELQAAVGLSAGQTALVEPPLNRWREAHATMDGTRRRDRDGRGPNDGNRERLGHREPPFMAFLADCSGALTDEQFSDLIDFLSERREQVREGRQAGMGPHGPGRGDHGARLAEQFGLDDAAVAVIRDAMQTAHEALRSIRMDHADGNATAEQVRDRAAVAVDELRTALGGVLSEDQLAGLVARLSERAGNMAARKLENMEAHTERRVEFLTKVLALDEAQVAEVESAMDGLLPRKEALLQGIQSGETNFPNALYEGLLIHEQMKSSLEGILTDGQQNRLEALKGLMRGPRHLRLYL